MPRQRPKQLSAAVVYGNESGKKAKSKGSSCIHSEMKAPMATIINTP